MLTTPVRHQWSILLSRQEGTRWLQCCSPTKSANSLILHLGLCTFQFFWFALRPWANDHFPNSPSSAISSFLSCVSPSYRLARSPSSPLSSFLSSLSQGSACTSPIAELSHGPCGTRRPQRQWQLLAGETVAEKKGLKDDRSWGLFSLSSPLPSKILLYIIIFFPHDFQSSWFPLFLRFISPLVPRQLC